MSISSDFLLKLRLSWCSWDALQLQHQCWHLVNQCTVCNNVNTFWSRYPNLVPPYGRLLKPTVSKLRLLKSAFNAESFICRLLWYIFTDFDTLKCASLAEFAKNLLKLFILGFKVVQGHLCWYLPSPGKLVSSACYDKQQFCVYVQPFSR